MKFTSQLSMAAITALFACNTTTFAKGGCPEGRMEVDFDVSQTQNSHIKESNTYIVVLGLNPNSHKHAYVQFSNGNSKLVDITSAAINGQSYGIPLSQLPRSASNQAQACIPYLTSGRVYLSFGNALDMPTEPNSLTPKQPDVNNPQTTTNGTLFDKVEFNYSTSGETVINPTGVDFLAIPYTIKQAGHEYGHAGNLADVIDNMKTIVCNAANVASNSQSCQQQWQQSEWSSLVKYNNQQALMRIDAPGRSGSNFNHYFANYIAALSEYYSATNHRAIKIDLRELNQGMWQGSFIPNTQTIVFKQQNGSNPKQYRYDLALDKASNSILMGAQAPFNNIDAIDATLARDLTSAIVSGMLMRQPQAFMQYDFFDPDGNPVFKNKQQMQQLMPFYFNNGDNSVDYVANQCGSSHNAPCINVYSEAMHALPGDKYIPHPQSSYIHSYAFSYDDFLGMDGTNTQTDKQPATITIGNMKDRQIPHISN
jgi:hypothetical protein